MSILHIHDAGMYKHFYIGQEKDKWKQRGHAAAAAAIVQERSLVTERHTVFDHALRAVWARLFYSWREPLVFTKTLITFCYILGQSWNWFFNKDLNKTLISNFELFRGRSLKILGQGCSFNADGNSLESFTFPQRCIALMVWF